MISARRRRVNAVASEKWREGRGDSRILSLGDGVVAEFGQNGASHFGMVIACNGGMGDAPFLGRKDFTTPSHRKNVFPKRTPPEQHLQEAVTGHCQRDPGGGAAVHCPGHSLLSPRFSLATQAHPLYYELALRSGCGCWPVCRPPGDFIQARFFAVCRLCATLRVPDMETLQDVRASSFIQAPSTEHPGRGYSESCGAGQWDTERHRCGDPGWDRAANRALDATDRRSTDTKSEYNLRRFLPTPESRFCFFPARFAEQDDVRRRGQETEISNTQ